MVDKYIFLQKGIPYPNPAYQAASSSSAPAAASSSAAAARLTVVSTLDDQDAMQALTQLPPPTTLQTALDVLQHSDYAASFGEVNNNDLIQGLMAIFGREEIPLGLITKLTAMRGDRFHFKIDSSGSMTQPSNVFLRQASPHFLKYHHIAENAPNRQLTRWQEVEDRMHVLIDILAYVPTGPIIFSLFDTQFDREGVKPGKQLILERKNQSPEVFLQAAHEAIAAFFEGNKPDGGTPIYLNMERMIREAQRIHQDSGVTSRLFLLGDGQPSGGAFEVGRIKTLLRTRQPESNPFTLIGCSNNPADYEWMSEVDEVAPLVAAVSDYTSESAEVSRDQGPAFPFSRGLWLLCNLAAATSPDDLDAIDELTPFTKPTLENLLGRGLMAEEYEHYFNAHPRAQRVFGSDYKLFCHTEFAREIPSVQIFKQALAAAEGRGFTEQQAAQLAEQAVARSRRAQQQTTETVAQSRGQQEGASRPAMDYQTRNPARLHAAPPPALYYTTPEPASAGCNCTML